MAEASAVFRRGEVQRLLRAIRDGEVEVIEPTLNYEDGVGYPALREITGASAEALESALKELSMVGCLTSEVVNNIAVCPTCGSHRLMVQIRCPTCGSPDLKRGVMIEHLSCGFLDTEENFRKGVQLVCPRCGRTLKAIGVDYRRPGVLYKCSNCGGMSPSPKKRCTCSGGHAFDEDELALREIRAYEPNPAKRALIERETVGFESLLKDLAGKGWHGQAPITLLGKSGIEHEFALALWAGESDPTKEPPDVLADMYASDAEVNSTMVLAFFAKTMDVEPKERVLIAMPRLDKKGNILAKSYNMHVVEAETATELKEKARNLLLSMVQKRERETLKAEAEELENILKAFLIS